MANLSDYGAVKPDISDDAWKTPLVEISEWASEPINRHVERHSDTLHNGGTTSRWPSKKRYGFHYETHEIEVDTELLVMHSFRRVRVLS